MTCKKCGKQINENLQFCPSCGCETGYFKPVKDGKKLGIWSILLGFDITLIGLLIGLIGLVRGIKAKDKLSIILNIVGIVVSVIFTIIYTIRIIAFIQSFKTLIQ